MSDQARIRVLCVDDHPLFRKGIAASINSQPDMLLEAEASNGGEAIQKYREYQPDVTLMDLRLPDMSDVEIHRSLGAGSRGYLLKSMPPKDLIEVIRIACHLF
jgi:DNA-binding NarL/FixJ family response regulator